MFDFVACSKAGSKSGAASKSNVALSIMTFQGLNKSNWKTDGSAGVYSNSRKLEISGKCTGLTKIQGFVDGVDSGQTATCASNGTFTWKYTVAADGTYNVQFQDALVSTVAQSGRSNAAKLITPLVSQTIIVMTVPPSPPVITTNGGMNLLLSNPSFEIDGTSDSKTVTVLQLGSSGGTIVFSPIHSTFSFTGTLNVGDVKMFSFVAVDVAGNQSLPTQIYVSCFGGAFLASAMISAANIETPITSVAGSTADAADISAFNSTSVISMSSNGTHQMITGFLANYSGF